MNANPPRNSNPALCGAFILLGVLCLLLTMLAALVLKNGIIERVRETPRVDALGDGFQVQSLDRQIEAVERDIEFQKKFLSDDPDAERRRLEKALERANKRLDTNLKLPIPGNRAEKIKELEEKKQQLIAQRDSLIGKSRAKSMKPRTLDEFFEDYSLDLFLPGVLPLGLFSLFLARFVFGGRLPARNPLSLTDLERRCLLFLPFAIVFSAFGFFLFVWILALVY